MYVFSNEGWHALTIQGTRDVVSLLNTHLLAPHDSGAPGPLTYYEDVSQETDTEACVPVVEAWCRPLEFYPVGWMLYRLTCLIGDVPDLAGYESRAFAFAVCGPERRADSCVLIDWTSTPIHRLNTLLKLDLSKVDKDKIREYLIFFCTFLGGSPDPRGTISPFLLPQHPNWFAWDDALEDLEVVARRGRLQLFSSIVNLNQEDAFDLPETSTTRGKTIETVDPSTPLESNETKRLAVQEAFAAHRGSPIEIPANAIQQATARASGDVSQPPDGSNPTGSSETGLTDDGRSVANREWEAVFEALVWYGDTLFLAAFRLRQDGGVEMFQDKPIAGATALPVPRWEAQHGPAGVPLLCRQMKREVVTAIELLRRIDDWIGQHRESEEATVHRNHRLRGLRVYGRLECASVYKGPVKLEDVEFIHEVVLDDAVFERSLELLGCRFLRRLSARDTTVRGAFRLDGARIDGAIRVRGSHRGRSDLGSRRPRPVVELRGLKTDRGLFADRVTAFGRVRAEWIRIGGPFRARGLQIHPRRGVDDGNSALDLSHAQIDGPVDLCGYVAKQREPGGQRRTVLGGSAVLNGLCADQIDLSGIWVQGYLDLASSDIKGRLRLNLVNLDRGNDRRCWRARIDHMLSLDRAKSRLIEMSGCFVGGDLHLAELQLEGSLFAELAGRFRTRVNGNIVGSGAIVRGGIELTGVRVGGEIHFVTGSIGRLSGNVGVWVDQDSASQELVPYLCPSEASGIILQDLSLDASISLAGIRLNGGPHTYSNGGMIAHGVRLGRGLRFWRGVVSTDLLRQEMLEMARVNQRPEVDRKRAIEHIEKLIAGVRTEIAGALDLRGLRAGGTTDLSRTRVGGELRMNNATIEGNLRAYFEGDDVSCSVNAFVADNARISGDADLRGLRVRTNDLVAREIEVAGQLLLATPPDSLPPGHANPCAEVSQGRVNLEGARAAQLVLSSANVASEVSDTANRAAITLSRARFGQLTITGFEELRPDHSAKRFPRTISLSAINVDDWDIDPASESLPLLEATAPRWFDGRNFVDVEQRLAKIGKKKGADKVYRTMLELAASKGVARARNRLNFLFSGNGTVPSLMFLWLLIFLVPVVVLLSNPSNVEFVSHEAGGPRSDGRPYDLNKDWDWIKAAGLAAGYAVPFLSGERSDVVRARLVGKTCVDVPLPAALVVRRGGAISTPTGGSPSVRQVPLPKGDPDPTAVFAPGLGSAGCEQVLALNVSPHGLAMIFSSIQFFLWILVAANLPAIARRRP